MERLSYDFFLIYAQMGVELIEQMTYTLSPKISCSAKKSNTSHISTHSKFTRFVNLLTVDNFMICGHSIPKVNFASCIRTEKRQRNKTKTNNN